MKPIAVAKRMTPEQVLQVIARGYDKSIGGRLRAIPRMEMVGMARDVCDQSGLTYAQSDLGLNGEDNDAVEQYEIDRAEAPAGEKSELEMLLVPDDDDADVAIEKME